MFVQLQKPTVVALLLFLSGKTKEKFQLKNVKWLINFISEIHRDRKRKQNSVPKDETNYDT